MKIELNCSSCGNNRFSLTNAMTDECQVFCVECGHGIGSLGQLKERMAEEILTRAVYIKGM